MNPGARHRLNVTGPFYVVDGACITCGAPEQEARALMSNEDGHCYFKRQPATTDESNRAIRAVVVSCCGAVRYGGRDPEILRRVAELGEAEQCDHPLPGNQVVVRRSVATFRFEGFNALDAAEEILSMVQSGLVRLGEWHRWEALPAIGVARAVSWSWYEGMPGVEIRVQPEAGPLDSWLLRLSRVNQPVPHTTAMAIDDILKGDSRILDVRWYTAEDWDQHRACWTELPY